MRRLNEPHLSYPVKSCQSCQKISTAYESSFSLEGSCVTTNDFVDSRS